MVKTPTFFWDQTFCFLVKDFLLSKLHENEARHNKWNFKWGLTVTFEVEIPKVTGKIQTRSKMKRFEKVWNSKKVCRLVSDVFLEYQHEMG